MHVGKLHEYDAHGIHNIWVINPRLQQLSVFPSGVLQDVRDGVFQTANGEVSLTCAEIFAA
ncbi:MAG: hypothetical protein JNM66_02930 [Bryobacterales bacterium]|nr:hypothetical protein [Bryobacterales bacterium]